jgi:hypothetical protein
MKDASEMARSNMNGTREAVGSEVERQGIRQFKRSKHESRNADWCC